jgi:hypothetical protein
MILNVLKKNASLDRFNKTNSKKQLSLLSCNNILIYSTRLNESMNKFRGKKSATQ